MNDMRTAIIPKSDQINADDLIYGPMTITIADVKISSGNEQPVSIFFHGSEKAYRPCKSMCRVLVSAWGADAAKYIGRSLTLYCDPKIKWGGMEVGGIRISHMSNIDSTITMALTATRANKKPFTVKPLDIKHIQNNVEPFDYDAAIDAMRAATNEDELKNAYLPAEERAKADRNVDMRKSLAMVKDEQKAKFITPSREAHNDI